MMVDSENVWYGITNTVVIFVVACVVLCVFRNVVTQFIVWLSGDIIAEFLVIFIVLMCVNLWLRNVIRIWKKGT